MLVKNTEQQFGLIAKLLHWSIALLMIMLIWLGWYMVRLSYYHPWSKDSLTTHKSLGLIVLALATFKVLWLIFSRTPKPLPTLKCWERKTSKLIHWILLLSMFLLPASGYLVSTSEGAAVLVFDWFEVPALLTTSEASRDITVVVHYYGAYVILALIVLHIAAALKHQFLNRDGTLRRML